MQFVEFHGWMAANKSQVKTVVTAFPDNQIGRIEADITDQASPPPPPDATTSSPGREGDSVNPDGVIAMGGGPV